MFLNLIKDVFWFFMIVDSVPICEAKLCSPVSRRSLTKTKHSKQETGELSQITEIPNSVKEDISQLSENVLHPCIPDKIEVIVAEKQFTATGIPQQQHSKTPLKTREIEIDLDETQCSSIEHGSFRYGKMPGNSGMLATTELCSLDRITSSETLPGLETQQSTSLLLQARPTSKQELLCTSKCVNSQLTSSKQSESAVKSDEDNETNKDSEDDFVIKYSKKKCFSLGLSPEKSTGNVNEDHGPSLEYPKSVDLDDSDIEFPDGCIHSESNATSHSEKSANLKSVYASSEFVPPTETILKKSSTTQSQTSSKDYVSVTDGASVDHTPIISIVPKGKKPLFRFMSDEFVPPNDKNTLQTQDDNFTPEIGHNLRISVNGFSKLGSEVLENNNSQDKRSRLNDHLLFSGRSSKLQTQEAEDVQQCSELEETDNHSPHKKDNFDWPSQTKKKSPNKKKAGSKSNRRKCRTVRGWASGKSPNLLRKKQELQQKQEVMEASDVINTCCEGEEYHLDENETPSDIFMMDSHMPSQISGRSVTCPSQGSDDLIRVHTSELEMNSVREDTGNVSQYGRTSEKDLSEVKDLSENKSCISETCSEQQNQIRSLNWKSKAKCKKSGSPKHEKFFPKSPKTIGLKETEENKLPKVFSIGQNKSPKFAYGSSGKQLDSLKRKLSRKMKTGSGSLSSSFQFTELSGNSISILERESSFEASGKAKNRDKHVGLCENNEAGGGVPNSTLRNNGVTMVPDSVLVSSLSNNCTQVPVSSNILATPGGKVLEADKFLQAEDYCDDDMLEIVKNVLGKNDTPISNALECTNMAALEKTEMPGSPHRFDACSPVIDNRSAAESEVSFPPLHNEHFHP